MRREDISLQLLEQEDFHPVSFLGTTIAQGCVVVVEGFQSQWRLGEIGGI